LLQINFLGDTALTGPMGSIDSSRRKELALLGFLVVETGQRHSRETLMGLLWPELPEADARNNLRVTLARLRKTLTKANAPGGILQSTRNDVTFQPTADVACDVATFQRLLAQTEQHDHDSRARCPDCAEALTAAAALYQGPLLPGLFLDDCAAFEEWLFVWRERLHLQATEALADLAQGLEENGRYPAATQFTRRLLELDPLHDDAQHRLLRLLAYQNQHNAALQQFQAFKSLLRRELGIDPDSGLLQLVQQIESRTLPIPGDASAQPPSETHAIHNLPESLTPFFGREEELTALSERLARPVYRLLTLIGPGGIGKTRLALEAARQNLHRFPGGVYFISLTAVEAVENMATAVAEALHLAPPGPDTTRQEQLIQYLAAKEMLLIIDNLEHLMDGVTLLLDIVRQCPDVVLLVTSRERLNVQAEDMFRLRGLPYPQQTNDPAAGQFAAVRLFTDRAHRLNKQFRLDADTLPAMVGICRAVDGLPLGLELAATWIRDFDVATLAAEIERDISLLATDLQDVADRHRSIFVMFEYSWKLLSAAEQAVLPLLALFRGGFTTAAARDILDASPLVLTRLRYKTLLQWQGNGRFDMHELIRQIAAMHQGEAAPSARRSYVRYYCGLLRAQAPRLVTYDALQAGQLLTADIENVRQAWQWGISQQQFAELRQAARALARFYVYTGLFREGIGLLDAALQGLPEALAGERPYFLIEKIKLAVMVDPFDHIEPLIQQTLDMCAGVPDLLPLQARAHGYLSTALLEKSTDLAGAKAHAEKTLALAQQLGNRVLEAKTYNQLGRIVYRERQYEQALSYANKALQLYEPLGHVRGMGKSYDVLAETYLEISEPVQTMAIDHKLLDIYERMGSAIEIADQYYNLAFDWSMLGGYQKADAYLQQAAEIYEQYNFEPGMQSVNVTLGSNAYCLGNDEGAIAYFHAAIALHEKTGESGRLSSTLTHFALPLIRLGQLDEAQGVLEKAIALSVSPNDRRHAETYLSTVLHRQGRDDAALVLAEKVWQAVQDDKKMRLSHFLSMMTHLHQLFRALNQSHLADDILHTTQDRIDDMAQKINDPELLERYWHHEPHVVYFKRASDSMWSG
jgi:DNA-binding SARP family transcriptional activator/predicted ATPase